MKNKSLIATVLAMSLLVLASQSVYAQINSATVQGFILNDETGHPIENAAVEWRDNDTGDLLENTTSGSDGFYVMNRVFDGTIESLIIASKTCYIMDSTVISTTAAFPPNIYDDVNLTLEEDTTGPTINDLLPPDVSFTNDTIPTICANYNDDSGINESSVKILVDGDDKTTDSNTTVTASGVSYTPAADLDEGSYTVTVNVSDNCTNPSSESWSFTVDTTSPEINSVSLRPTEVSAGASITVTVIARDNFGVENVTAKSVSLRLTSGNKTSGTWTGAITAASTSGSHTVAVIASDAAGNSATDTSSYTVTVRRRGGGGGGAPKDSDGDGYTDVEEMLAETDKEDPCDPNPECAACLAIKPAATPTPMLTPTAAPTAKPTTPPAPTPKPTAEPTPTEEPGFEAVFAIAGLLAVAYLVLRRKK